jgi:ABC-2 type transport system ATP-binding protein
MSEYAIHCEGVGKQYGETQALNDICFSVKRGEIFGFIGPDGAGKTSLFRILTTLLLPDTGTAIVEGYDVVKDYKALRKILGYMPGKFSLYQDLTVEENLNFFAGIFNADIRENYYLIKDIYDQIAPFAKRRAGKLSGGMKQKLALSCALIHKPVVLVLDEPTTGVDAVSRREFWEMLIRLKKEGITIIVATPIHGRGHSLRPCRTHTAWENSGYRHSGCNYTSISQTAFQNQEQQHLRPYPAIERTS